MSEEKGEYLPVGEEVDIIEEELDNEIRDESATWKWFWQTPNIVDDFDLSPHAYRLYMHLKRVCGDNAGYSWAGSRYLAEFCNMSVGGISNAKKELVNHNPPLIRIQTRIKKDNSGVYHHITIVDLWRMNQNHFNGEKPVHLKKLQRIEDNKKKKNEEIVKKREGRSLGEQGCSGGETRNTTIKNTNYLPAIAGDKLCEECKEDKMCEKCEMLNKKIKLGTEYGFEFDVKNSKEMLKNLTELHKTEDPTENKKVTQNERIVAMMQGSKDEYADKLADYPDRCRKPLNYFLHKWQFSPSAVPKKSKSKGGMFAAWISGIDDLIAISGEKRFELVLDKVYEIWYNRSSEYKNVVDMPQKIRPLFISCDAELRQEEIATMKEEMRKTKEKFEEKKEFVSAEDGSKLLKQLQKSMKNKSQ